MVAITVLGAGVVGLSTAIELQDRGFEVTVIAECLPGDKKSIRYTSPWAGAHHVSAAQDEWQLAMDKATFDKMWKMSAPNSPTEGLFMRLPQVEYYVEKRLRPSILQFMPDYEDVPDDELPSYASSGSRFQTVTIDTPNYLLYLLQTVKDRGGRVKRASIQHISQIVDGGFDTGSPSAVVVCAGIGARSLGGVEDKTVYPIRGQTVLINAPWIKFGRTCSSADGTWTYVIPRRSGEVIVGGTKAANDWYPHPRPEITEDILQRALTLCPELAPEEIRATREPVTEDLKPLIIEEGCGLRPGRENGIRLEGVKMTNRDNIVVPVVFNYGAGGYGYQSSWGSAINAADLLEAALKGEYKNSRSV